MTYTALRFLQLARRDHDVRFDATLTIGRQSLYLSSAEARALTKEFGLTQTLPIGDPYADAFFRAAFGVENINSIDVSSYEGATLLHDLNRPVPVEWDECADVVIDGGALEHVFNFPTALASCMRMVRTGGHLVIFAVANNNCGHGFYQFSPELFFRALASEHGFEITRMIALPHLFAGAELGGNGRWHEVTDPASVRERVVVMGARGLALLVLARKLRHVVPFESAPQQSDYSVMWNTASARGPSPSVPPDTIRLLRQTLSRELPRPLVNIVRGVQQRIACSLLNRKHFNPVRR